MNIYAQIYEFAASAGALEGYLYHQKDVEMNALAGWVDNLLSAYKLLPSEALNEFQSSCDGTLGRAIRSLTPILGEGHEVVRKLQSMIVGDLPESPDDFQKRKWFQK